MASQTRYLTQPLLWEIGSTRSYHLSIDQNNIRKWQFYKRNFSLCLLRYGLGSRVFRGNWSFWILKPVKHGINLETQILTLFCLDEGLRRLTRSEGVELRTLSAADGSLGADWNRVILELSFVYENTCKPQRIWRVLIGRCTCRDAVDPLGVKKLSDKFLAEMLSLKPSEWSSESILRLITVNRDFIHVVINLPAVTRRRTIAFLED